MLRRLLDAGALGEVWISQDLELQREVAVKRISLRITADAGSRDRFLREADITSQFEHPGVVPVYGYGIDPTGRPWYAMRLVRGINLRDAISHYRRDYGGQIRPGQADVAFRALLRRFLAVCGTISYAHSRGVVHRDLKPSNIMLGTREGDTIVLDWGLGKPLGLILLSEEGSGSSSGPVAAEGSSQPVIPRSGSEESDPTRVGARVGTPRYMSPEQARGEPATFASDIYGLGATLYHLLTFRPPFSEFDAGEVLEHVQAGDIRDPRQVNTSLEPALAAIALKAMAFDPADRYASATTLANDLERWLADEPVSVYRDRTTTRLRRWGRRHRAIVHFGSALLVALAASSLPLAFALRSASISAHQSQLNEQLAIAQGQESDRERRAAIESERRIVDQTDQLVFVLRNYLPRQPRSEQTQRLLCAEILKVYRDRLAHPPHGDEPRLQAAWVLAFAAATVSRHETRQVSPDDPAPSLPDPATLYDEAINSLAPMLQGTGIEAETARILQAKWRAERAAWQSRIGPYSATIPVLEQLRTELTAILNTSQETLRNEYSHTLGQILAYLARAYEATGQAEPARQAAAEAISRLNDSSEPIDVSAGIDAYLSLSRAYDQHGNSSAAAMALGRGLEWVDGWLQSDPSSPEALEWKSWLELEQLSQQTRAGVEPDRQSLRALATRIQDLRNDFREIPAYPRLLTEYALVAPLERSSNTISPERLRQTLLSEISRRLAGPFPHFQDRALMTRLLAQQADWERSQDQGEAAKRSCQTAIQVVLEGLRVDPTRVEFQRLKTELETRLQRMSLPPAASEND